MPAAASRGKAAPFMWVHADHSVTATDGGTRATLTLHYAGFAARLLGRLTRGITNRYLRHEAEGLKRRSEHRAAR
jgi:hypothetical protein